jgi:hypothetical protein
VQQPAGAVVPTVVGDLGPDDLGARPRPSGVDVPPGLAGDVMQTPGGVLELAGLVLLDLPRVP